MARFAHRAPQKMHAGWYAALRPAAMAFLALIAIGAIERRAPAHVGGDVTGHDVTMPMLDLIPTG